MARSNSRHQLPSYFYMQYKLILLFLLALGAHNAVCQSSDKSVDDDSDWVFQYDKAVAFETKKKHRKAYKSLFKAAELAIETLNEKKMLERMLADQVGALQYLATGTKNYEWEHIRKALETRDTRWLKETVHDDSFHDHNGHNH